MRFLIFGDVVSRPGREAITKALPELREEYKPDSIIVNVENIAHGNGISPTTMTDAVTWHADAFTTGDHAWDNKAGLPLLNSKAIPVIRPANYPAGVPGRGYHIYTSGMWQVAVINLQGQVFFKNHPDNPFTCLDRLLEQDEIKKAHIKLLDFHVEATSEARAMGWHADGRISAMWGTHTHVPTADAQILPLGTGYITDVGMNGNYRSIIGGDRSLLAGFLKQTRAKFSVEDEGPLEIGALLLDIDPTSGQTTNIAQIRKIMDA